MANLFGKEIKDKCPCGVDVKPTDAPQGIVFDDTAQCWFRICARCLKAGAKFS